MSSDEKAMIMEHNQGLESSLEDIRQTITTYQIRHKQLLQEQNDLMAARDTQRDMTEKFRERSEKLKKSLKEDQISFTKDVELEKENLSNLAQERDKLYTDIQVAMAALKELEINNEDLKQQTNMSTAVPERKVVFTGATGDAADTQKFDMETHIVYPMEGGTALITFEDELVAKNILQMKKHKVVLQDDFSITLGAYPVQLMVPGYVEMDTQVCPHRILVSNLRKEDENILLDKLDIHFSKSRNGGGEVDYCDLLHDSGNVVITFFGDNVAKGLTERPYHEVEFQKGKKHRVKVTPFLNGEITSFKAKQSVCARTVLLTGIPAIMDRESMQDLLEIHFQREIHGGGEVEYFLYNPLGQNTLARFEADAASAK